MIWSMNVYRSKWDIFVNEEQDKMFLRFSFKYNIFLKEYKKYNKFKALSLNMKHYVTASINKYLCFINYIKHYSSYLKCMFMDMMLKGCGNAVVLFVFLCEVCPNATDTLMPLDLQQMQKEKESIYSVIICQHTLKVFRLDIIWS